MKILIIEDRESDAKLLRSVLERGGQEVHRAGSAEEALQLLAEGFQPQAIVTDLDLPQTDGITLARCLNKSSRTANIPIIALTAYPDHFPHGSQDRLCFAAYVVKPIDTRTLAGLVVSICESQTMLATYSGIGTNS